MPYYEIRQFDKIKLRTTKNIRYLSAPPNEMPSPHGIWTVVANINKDLLICKGDAICRVPVSDVVIAGRSEIDRILERIDGKKAKAKSE